MTAPDTPVPPGTYAGQGRSPVVWVSLCPPCGGYAPTGWHLPGQCQGCGSWCGEQHRLPSLIDSAAGCECRLRHQRVTGDLAAAGSAAELVRWLHAEVADLRGEAPGAEPFQRAHREVLANHLTAAIAHIAVMRRPADDHAGRHR